MTARPGAGRQVGVAVVHARANEPLACVSWLGHGASIELVIPVPCHVHTDRQSGSICDYVDQARERQ
jgi:hypothetical protein